jgi:hypothetical protein
MAYGVLALVSATLHGLWEYMHISLYTGYEALGWGMPITVFATVGDVLYVCGVAAALSYVMRSSLLRVATLPGTTYIILGLMGCVIALFVEYKAFYFERWHYTDMMPIVPFLGVGLSPLVQMSIVLPLSVYVTRAILKRYA